MVETTYAAKQSLAGDAFFRAELDGEVLTPIHKEDPLQRAEFLAELAAMRSAFNELLLATTAMATTLASKLDAINANLGGAPQLPPQEVGSIVATWRMDLVQNLYTGATAADLTVIQPNARDIPNNDGSLVNRGPNVVGRSDLGVLVSGLGAEFIGAESLTPATWDITPLGWTGTALAPSPGDAHGPFTAPAIMTSNGSAEGWVRAGFTEPVEVGDVIRVKFRAKHKTPGVGFAVVFRNDPELVEGDTQEGWIVPNLTVDGNPPVISNRTFNGDGVMSEVVSYERDAALGEVEIHLTHTVTDPDVGVYVVQTGGVAAGELGILGLQVSRGAGDQPWTAVANATVAAGVDDYRLGGAPLAALQGNTGWIGFEVRDLDLHTIGTNALGGDAGTVLKCGNARILEPKGQVGFRAADAQDRHLGEGGWSGIVRIAIAWDAGGWIAYANGSEVASGIGALNRAGIAHLMSGLTGWLRIAEGGTTLPASTDLLAWSRITSRTFVRPKDAMVPASPMVQTWVEDNNSDPFQTITAPAFPYPSNEALAFAYRASWLADKNRKLKDRAHFWTQNAFGSGPNQINNEPQFYLAKRPENYQAHEIVAGEYRQHLRRTANLTAPQAANVSIDPVTGLPFKYVSALASTFGQNSEGGFNQRFGMWATIVKAPASPGTWLAFWLYNYFDTSEMDIIEYYGHAPNDHTSALHAFADGQTQPFGYNNGGPVNMGYNLSEDFHSWACIWEPGEVRVYLDGKLVQTHATNAEFDKAEKFMMWNLAATHNPAPTAETDALADADQLVARWDRTSVYQFAAV